MLLLGISLWQRISQVASCIRLCVACQLSQICKDQILPGTEKEAASLAFGVFSASDSGSSAASWVLAHRIGEGWLLWLTPPSWFAALRSLQHRLLLLIPKLTKVRCLHLSSWTHVPVPMPSSYLIQVWHDLHIQIPGKVCTNSWLITRWQQQRKGHIAVWRLQIWKLRSKQADHSPF